MKTWTQKSDIQKSKTDKWVGGVRVKQLADQEYQSGYLH